MSPVAAKKVSLFLCVLYPLTFALHVSHNGSGRLVSATFTAEV